MNGQITVDPRICNGKPVISGSGIPVTVVLDQLAETGPVQEVLRRYPELSSAGQGGPAVLPFPD